MDLFAVLEEVNYPRTFIGGKRAAAAFFLSLTGASFMLP